MAKIGAFKDKDGDTIYANAYYRVKDIQLDRDSGKVAFNVLIYKSKAKREASRLDTISKVCISAGDFTSGRTVYDTYFADSVLKSEETTPLKQAYVYMGTLPAYEDLEDDI